MTVPTSPRPTISTYRDLTTSRPRRARLGLAAVALTLGVSVLAPLAAGPAVAGASTVDPAAASDQVMTPAASGSSLSGRLVVEDGLNLRLLEANPGRYTTAQRPLPQAASAGTSSFLYDGPFGRNVEVNFTYDIDGAYVLYADIRSPAASGNKIHAEIRKKGQTHADTSSPYNVAVAWQWNGEVPKYNGWDPRPYVKVSKKPVVTVTDRHEQGLLLDRLCADGGDQCSYVPKTFAEKTQGQVVNKVRHQNNGELDSRHDYKVIHTTTVTNRSYTEVKLKLGFDILVAKAEFGIKQAYDHSVSRTETIDERITMNVPAGHDGRIDVIEMWQKVNGDIVLQDAGVTYQLVDVDFDFPAVPVWVVTTTPFAP